MDKETRNAIERATQRARKLLEEDFAAQLEGDFDVHRDGEVAAKAGKHLTARQAFARERIVAAIEHKRAAGLNPPDAARDYLRDAAFTNLNRFVALKMLEARELVQECITKGEQSGGYREFCGMAPGLPLLPESAGYRLYIESLFDELSTEVKVLFDRRDPSSVLWPKRVTFKHLLDILNATELARVWGEDETIGWVYQFFNGQDERRKMREESQAPRNSRELAVRNQFFTPRYVVQFLTDNTLGRIWYEMHATKTTLADKCVYMVRKSGEAFAPRAKKDPRDLRILDPACGSGHFLLYAFDLLLAIYEESYADAASPKSEATGKTLAEDYPTSVEELRKELPKLILAHNIHGIDIDSRCAQIAQLALWMRAQKAYRDFGIGRSERGQIRRSNIVVAEPLVADEQIAREFVSKLGDAELGRVFTSLVVSLSLAGDLGLLLRVEQLIAPQAKLGKTGDLFAPPEERIRAAVDRFVHEEASATNTRRRLFADDAAHGVGLLSVAEKKFDAILMNPPFGAGSVRAKNHFEKAYPRTKADVYAAFVERSIELLHDGGRIGAITSRTGFFLSSFQEWREKIVLSDAPPVVFADLGYGVMDAAMVEAAAYCLAKLDNAKPFKSMFVRAIDAADKACALRAAAQGQLDTDMHRFEVDPRSFAMVPGSPFAYQASDKLRQLFSELPAFEGPCRIARGTNSVDDNSRFVRSFWEVHPQLLNSKWRPWSRGGAFAPYYYDLDTVVAWDDSRESYPGFLGTPHRPLERPASVQHFFRPGLTWPLRTNGLSVRVLPAGSIFTNKGPAAFVKNDDSTTLLALLAVANSRPFGQLVSLQLARTELAQSYVIGLIQQTPVPAFTESSRITLANLAARAWSLKRSIDTSNETSHAFLLPSGLNEKVTGLDHGSAERELEAIQKQIDAAAFTLYKIAPEDRASIESSCKCTTFSESSFDAETEEDGEERTDERTPEFGWEAVPIISWLVGVAFGRFDPRLATGERPIPPDPKPFDSLPTRSPGMWPQDEVPDVVQPDIMVDDPGHDDDLRTHVARAAANTGIPDPEDLRQWLAKEFFPEHIKMYSKSRRKAPIYWQLATPSAGYSVWLYIHAFTKDTLFRVQNDYVVPKLAHEERRLESLTNELRDGATAAQRKQFTAQKSLIEELHTFLDEVKCVAPLWKPNLDDGVILNFAPLWRLVPHNKAWQRELKSTWDALCEGKYDWANLAMHLWPERVIPKCAKDRSLAIAHGLEDVFWVEGTDGKWTARKRPTKSVDDLVKERTSPAVKSALKNLLEAPVASGKSSKRKTAGGRQKAVAAAEGGDA